MKYSVRGTINTADGAPIVDAINNYALWRLVTQDAMDNVGADVFTFEAWVNVEADKTGLFADLKPFVDVRGGMVDWHECTHDEAVVQPCIIFEEYKRG